MKKRLLRQLSRFGLILGVTLAVLMAATVVEAVVTSSEYWAGTATPGRLFIGVSGSIGRFFVGFGDYAVAPTTPPYTGYLFPPSTATSSFTSGYLFHVIVATIVVLGSSLATSAMMRMLGSGSLIIKSAVIVGVMGIFVAMPNESGVAASGTWLDFWMIVFFLMMATAIMMGSKQVSW